MSMDAPNARGLRHRMMPEVPLSGAAKPIGPGSTTEQLGFGAPQETPAPHLNEPHYAAREAPNGEPDEPRANRQECQAPVVEVSVSAGPYRNLTWNITRSRSRGIRRSTRI